MKTISKILVPIDFGDSSLKALDDAIELARTFGASVVVLHAYDSPVVGTPAEGVILTPLADAASLVSTIDTTLRTVVESRAGRGVELEALLREGPAWRTIDAVAVETGADLIVLGTHGQHSMLHALLGSVSEKVVRTARKPVLTIPTPPVDAARDVR
jgi:nucleotide-binding universal stress UspA family protein